MPSFRPPVAPPRLLRRWVASCSAVWLASGLAGHLPGAVAPAADPLLEPPVVNVRPGPEYQDDVRVAGMVIGMDRTPKGRIWGSWTGTGDNSESYFLLATSDDGGATWSKPRVVIDPAELPGRPPRYALIGNLWCDPLGRMWLFFDQHMKGYAQTGWFIRCDNPDAPEPVWSQPTLVSDGSTLNKPLVLKHGEWLLPVSLLVPGRGAGPAHQPMVHTYVSTDQGRTWNRRGGVALPPADVNHNEPMFVELRDGRLWMLMRTRYGIAESFSPDRGRTWSAAAPSAIQNPATRFFLRRLASGRLLLVKNGPIGTRTAKRTQMSAFLSDDDGRTWSRGLMLDERDPVTYPDGFEEPNGLIRILYDRDRHGVGEILMASFREADVLAGQLVSGDARLRHLVNAPRAPHLSPSTAPDPHWAARAAADAKLDVTRVIYDGAAAKRPARDASLRLLPDGSWGALVATGDETEARSLAAVSLALSSDHGTTWSALQPLATGLPRDAATPGLGPVELIGADARSTLLVSTHGPVWPDGWRAWLAPGPGAPAAGAKPVALPGRLAQRTFVRNALVARDGRILVPFQHHEAADRQLEDPRCGVIASRDGGRTWTEHGNIRLRPIQRRFDWAESNLVELGGGRLVLLLRSSGLMGAIYRADSDDGGRTWPAAATLQRAPSLGTAAFHSLGGDAVAMVHNPAGRLALWISLDGMKSWPYQRTLTQTTSVGPKENMSQAHGFVSADRAWLHFAFVDKAQRAVSCSARLPALP